MGRKRTFDTQEAVRAARSVFWSNGFEGASLPDLEQATGLNRSSLYHAFGSKRGLFDAVVDSYLDEVIRPRLRVLTQDPVPPDAVRTYLNGMKAALLAPASAASEHGCLMVNTAASPIAKDEAVRERVAAYRAEVEAAIARGLTHQPGFDPSRVAPTAMAVTSLIVAAMTLTRIDAAAAAETIDAALAIACGEAAEPYAR
ncbi:TetR/AcrR family transcriptional regulator [Demequina lutea]|uniref:AcrR family transcriptional regulator n=1 Tax=Demequina lutea TaxID=431489 RepID=A0A7Z0CJB1_9MICO|nr:TetR/AcrR family transcriptional regulator [Demequina lutea]NYI40738.1 AcrR family transcriptional regulator [Demequina lutea]